jgi:transposase
MGLGCQPGGTRRRRFSKRVRRAMTVRSGRSVSWPGPGMPPGGLGRAARIVVLSWDGLGVPAIAGRLGCHPKKVRRWLHRFNAAGIDGLGDRPGAGRRRRITGAQRSAIIAMAQSEPPGRLDRDADGELSAGDERGPAQWWTLDALAQVARDAGITVGRSQVRRILLAEKVRWRRTRSWATSTDPEFAPKGPASWSCTPPAGGLHGDLRR